MHTIKFIDLFAGIGGIRKGFELACAEKGYKSECVFTSEIKPYAVDVLAQNHPSETITGDITKVDKRNLSEDEIAATNAADEACQNETQYKNIVDLYLSLKENPENVDTDQLARQQNDKTLACLKKHGIVDDSVTADAYDELATMGESGGTSFDDLIGKYALKDNPAYDKRKAAIIEQCGAL